jgi:hypothetical protein
MPSEYDFLLPYSGPLRRVGTFITIGGAFLGGMICTAVVVALAMKTPDDAKDAGTVSWLHPPVYELAAESKAPASAPTTASKAPALAGTARADTAPSATPRPAAQDGAKPTARSSDRPPETPPRHTVGQSNPSPKPEDRAPPAATAASTEPSAGEMPAPAALPQAATSEPEAKPDRPRKRVNRARGKSKAARRRGGEREQPREFVDAYGRRHVVLPRNWQGDGRDMAYERPSGFFAHPVPGGYYSRY